MHKLTSEQKSHIAEAHRFAKRNTGQPYACEVIESLLDIIEQLRAPADPDGAWMRETAAAVARDSDFTPA